MKLIFNLLILCFLLLQLNHAEASLIVLSGTPEDWQRSVVSKVLKEDYPSLGNLVEEEKENEKCSARKKVLLQLCFKEGKVFYVVAHPNKLKKTIQRLMVLEDQTEKPFISKGHIN